MRTPLVIVVALVASACAHVAQPIRVGTSGDYPPFSKDGVGFDIAIAERLTKDLGRKIVWVPFDWPSLRESVEQGAFDVAMGGITWRPDRATDGYMTRAVAVTGPCVVGSSDPDRVAVNRGGILETWTRATYSDAIVVTTDDNLSLPQLLASDHADAFVTDSLEVEHLREKDDSVECAPPTDRKVYWVTDTTDDDLGPRIDEWLRDNEAVVAELRTQYLGTPSGWTSSDHLADLLARRLAFMPSVGAWKREHSVPIEDLEREAKVLGAASAHAAAKGLDAARAEEFFVLQIDLAKRVQRRSATTSASLGIDQVRPVLIALGARIVDALAALRDSGERFDRSAMSLLEPYLRADELDDLADRIDALIAPHAGADAELNEEGPPDKSRRPPL